jgi:tetratricopeptide (TPR) repeat protein
VSYWNGFTLHITKLWEATALLYLGKAQLAAGDPGGALVSYQRCEVLSRQESDISRGAWALDGAGLAYSVLGRPDDAAQFHRLAISVFRQIGDRWKLAKSLARLADALPEDPAEAIARRREAIQILADFPDVKSQAIRSRLLAATGDTEVISPKVEHAGGHPNATADVVI